MAATSKIQWTDSTFNPWIGCTRISPGCDDCYAARSTPTRTFGIQWGAGQPRKRTSAELWKHPLAWNNRTFYECLSCGHRFSPPRKDGFVTCPSCSSHGGRMVDDEEDASRVKTARRRVFCASLADWLDNEAPIAWFVDLMQLIRTTPNLDWLLLTKRIGNFKNRLDGAVNWIAGTGGDMSLARLIGYWRDGKSLPHNVWLGATVVNQEEVHRDVPKLIEIRASVRFLSCEPLLGPIDVAQYLDKGAIAPNGMREFAGRTVDWVIVGGESGSKAREFHVEWAQSLADQCKAAGVPMFMKQVGARPMMTGEIPGIGGAPARQHTAPLQIDDLKGGDPMFWPSSIRVREFPRAA